MTRYSCGESMSCQVLKPAFTLAEVSPIPINIRRAAFTLSEVLITLGIIGIVAALVLPQVIGNANDRKYRGARQKALATIGESVKNITVTEGIGTASDAQDFVENHLKKQIQMIKTCKNNDLRSCGIETTAKAITTLTEPKTKTTMPKKFGDLALGISYGDTIDANLTSYGFVMSNGYSVNLFYNPNCLSDDKNENHSGQDRVCVNAIYDMNGLARPNEVGKDIGFVTVIYPDMNSQAVAFDVYKQDGEAAVFDKTDESCKKLNKEYAAPTKDESLAMYMNMYLLGANGAFYWSSSEAATGLGWYVFFNNGFRYRTGKQAALNVRCIRR